MSDELDQTMEQGMKWLSEAWKAGLKEKSDLSAFMNVEAIDEDGTRAIEKFELQEIADDLTLRMAIGRPIFEFRQSVTLAIRDIRDANHEVERIVQEFGRNWRVVESHRVLEWVCGEVPRKHQYLLDNPDELATALHHAFDQGTGSVQGLLLQLAHQLTLGRPEVLSLNAVARAVGEHGRNMRLLVPPHLVKRFAEEKLVETVGPVPDEWPGHALLMGLASGPTVKRFAKEPALVWRRGPGDAVRLAAADRFLVDNANRGCPEFRGTSVAVR